MLIEFHQRPEGFAVSLHLQSLSILISHIHIHCKGIVHVVSSNFFFRICAFCEFLYDWTKWTAVKDITIIINMTTKNDKTIESLEEIPDFPWESLAKEIFGFFFTG